MRNNNVFYLVWRDGGRNPEFRHPSEDSARKEAERLARSAGGRFYVLMATAFYERNDVTCVDLRDECPF